MLFNSPVFLLVFLPLFWTAYFIVPGLRLRNAVIVAFSLFFFAWGDPVFVGYVVAGTWLDYMVIRHVLTVEEVGDRWKKIWLTLAIAINVGALLFFKYFNFFIDQITPLLTLLGAGRPSWYGVALPLGISFIAFHKISFLLDLDKHRTTPPDSYLDTLLYILFFPQLIAGPIVRYYEIGGQIRSREESAEDFLKGLFRFARGLAKKALLADPAGGIVSAVFAMPPESLPVHYAWVGVVAYALQIYFDFSGYSDMAIGLARTVGFRFPENFNQPYVSASVTEFWRRWHITLSNWMRLYLYIPLGGNRVAPARMYCNLWLVFLISGLWHGAAWTFICWGAYHGFFLTLEKFAELRGWRFPVPRPVKQLLTAAVVLNAWALFRADSLGYAARLIGRMYGLVAQTLPAQEPFALLFPPHGLAVLGVGLLIAVVRLPQWARELGERSSLGLDTMRWATSVILFTASLASLLAAGGSSFLYFRF